MLYILQLNVLTAFVLCFHRYFCSEHAWISERRALLEHFCCGFTILMLWFQFQSIESVTVFCTLVLHMLLNSKSDSRTHKLLCFPSCMVQQEQHRVPGGERKVPTSIRDLNEAVSQCNRPPCPMGKSYQGLEVYSRLATNWIPLSLQPWPFHTWWCHWPRALHTLSWTLSKCPTSTQRRLIFIRATRLQTHICSTPSAAATGKSCQSCPTVRPPRRQPTSLPGPWDSPGKNTGVGCHFLLQCMKVKSESEVTQSCLTLSDPRDCSLPGSSIHGIFQARVLEWGAIVFSTVPPQEYLNSSSIYYKGEMYFDDHYLWYSKLSMIEDIQLVVGSKAWLNGSDFDVTPSSARKTDQT